MLKTGNVTEADVRASTTEIDGDDAAPVHVLLVDQQPVDIQALRAALDAQGLTARVHRVGSGTEAAEYVRRQGIYRDTPRPDLVLARGLESPPEHPETAITSTGYPTADLCASVLNEIGLTGAVEQLGTDSSKLHGLSFDFGGGPGRRPLGESQLYLEIQRLLWSLVAIARAKEICSQVSAREGAIDIELTEDAAESKSSAPEPADQSDNLCLRMLLERLEVASSRLEVDAEDGASTRLSFTAVLRS